MIIRQLINITVSLLLLVTTTGFSISTHYCGDTLVSVELNKVANPCCDNPHCCQTDTFFAQLEGDFDATANTNLENTHVFDITQYPAITLISNNYFTQTAISLNNPLKFPLPKTQLTLTGLQSFLL